MLQSQEMRLEHLNAYQSCGSNQADSNGGRGGLSRGNKLISQVCGKVGHTAIKYYHHFDLNFQGPNQASNSQSHGGGSQALVATSDDVLVSAWYMDSGATSHVTSELANLLLKTDYQGKGTLTVGQNFEDHSGAGPSQ